MFSTFTTDLGALIIRTQDIRSMEDRADGCVVVWESAQQIQTRIVHGTAAENLARLKTEEMQAVEEGERMRKRITAGQPALPIPRGRPS